VFHTCYDGVSVFSISSKRSPHFVASYDTQGGVGETILTQIFMGHSQNKYLCMIEYQNIFSILKNVEVVHLSDKKKA
jgi:hypothetical protein